MHRCFVSLRLIELASASSTRSHFLRHAFATRFLCSRLLSAASRPKSLIDDEAELSDWISDLKSDSVRFNLDSDGDGDDSGRRRGSHRSMSNGSGSSGRFREKSGNISRDRDIRGGFDKGSFRDSGNLRNFRSSVGRKKFGRGLDDDDDDIDDDDDDDNVSSRNRSRMDRGPRERRMAVTRKGNRPGGFADRWSQSESDFDDKDDRSIRGSRGRKDGGSRNSATDRSRREGDFGKREPNRGARFGVPRQREEKNNFGHLRGGNDDVFSRGRKVDFDLSDAEDADESNDDTESEHEESSTDFLNSISSPAPAKKDGLVPRASTGEDDSYLSQTRFDECSLSALTLKGVKSAGYERMTVVQEATLPVILKGKDVLAKARTGTGKTVAFLLPAIELVTKLPPVDRDQKRPPINVLVVCPTRELADQAYEEAGKLLKYHSSIGAQLVIGGTRLALEQKRLQTDPCQLLVATPGRLRDHMENTPGFSTRLMGVKVLVLDEADRLLDMGFRTDIEKIVAALPKQRQTLLFSATVPDEVRQICYIAMRRDFEFVNTVKEGSEETHAQVKQLHLVTPVEKHFSTLYCLLTEHIAENVDYKVIVFCTTAMMTKLVADLLSELKLNVREIHSRKPQTYRSRISKEFKESKGLILVSSDVSARGVDYPNVTLVVQIGVPADREQYIHRLGRTGRKGKEGTGILILAPWENFFLRSIQDLPITEAPPPLIVPDARKKVEQALQHVEMKNKESAYQAWLGYYNSNKNIGRDKHQLVSLANEFSRSMGLNNPPAISRLVLGKMGLNNIPGLRSK